MKAKKSSRAHRMENNLKRALADYANLEKRVKREKQIFVKLANAVLIEKLLAVLDDLERAEKHLKDKGLSMAIDQLRVILFGEGVEEIKSLGEKFDAQLMDCVEVVKGPKDKVMAIVNKGYKLNDHVLRPTKVKIGSTKNV